MDIRADDLVYVIAVRARGEDQGRVIGEVLREADFGDDVVAAATGMTIEDAYRRQVCDRLAAMGMAFDDANQVVPVAVETQG